MGFDNSEIFHRNGIALRGYDVVAYFILDRAVEGMQTLSFEWKDKQWWFSSEEHLELFRQNPQSYEPQYGGYCAFGVSNGYKASTKPAAFTIIDGKLYFNFAGYVKRRWTEKQAMHITSANQKWEEVKETVPIGAKPIPIWWKYQFLKLFGKDIFG